MNPNPLRAIADHARDPLYKNSFFILLTPIVGAGFGFIFWTLAAKLYLAQDVGIATALISSLKLLALLSRFGLDLSIIRFFPEYDKNKVFSASTIITMAFTVFFGILSLSASIYSHQNYIF